MPPTTTAQGGTAMPLSFRSFTDAFRGAHTPTPVAANDNRPRKQPEPRYRGKLPALRWLFDNHPELAEHVAAAVKSLSRTNWRSDAVDDVIELRPLPGELVAAATAAIEKDADGNEVRHWHDVVIDPKPAGSTYADPELVTLGNLRFNRGVLVEWGQTKKGRKLRPTDRTVSREADRPSQRSPGRYLATEPTTPSPMQAEALPRNVSDAPALPPMYDPLPRIAPNDDDKHGRFGVEEGRALLRELGVDGSVAFERLPVTATKAPTVAAKGAGFIGGISRSSGTASSGAPEPWEGPAPRPKGEVWQVIDLVAARADLKGIGCELGYAEAKATAMGKIALVDAAKALVAANDNERRRKIAA